MSKRVKSFKFSGKFPVPISRKGNPLYNLLFYNQKEIRPKFHKLKITLKRGGALFLGLASGQHEEMSQLQRIIEIYIILL